MKVLPALHENICMHRPVWMDGWMDGSTVFAFQQYVRSYLPHIYLWISGTTRVVRIIIFTLFDLTQFSFRLQIHYRLGGGAKKALPSYSTHAIVSCCYIHGVVAFRGIDAWFFGNLDLFTFESTCVMDCWESQLICAT